MGTDDLRPTRRIVKAACPHDCPDTCAMEIAVENGVAVEVKGGDMPFTQGVLCGKVSKYLDRTYAKDRVLHPLKRVGPKGPGNDRWERITWDEALDTIAAKFTAIARRRPAVASCPTATPAPWACSITRRWTGGSSTASARRSWSAPSARRRARPA